MERRHQLAVHSGYGIRSLVVEFIFITVDQTDYRNNNMGTKIVTPEEFDEYSIDIK